MNLDKENDNPNTSLQKEADLKPAIRSEREYRSAIEQYQGTDPLVQWIEYIQWLQDTFHACEATLKLRLLPVLAQCTTEFQDSAQYKNSQEYIRLWITYANMCGQPLRVFSFMLEQGIGQRLALFYKAYATVLEGASPDMELCDAMYMQGMAAQAAPFGDLLQAYQDFKQRWELSREKTRQAHEAALRHQLEQVEEQRLRQERQRQHAQTQHLGSRDPQADQTQTEGAYYECFIESDLQHRLKKQSVRGEWYVSYIKDVTRDASGEEISFEEYRMEAMQARTRQHKPQPADSQPQQHQQHQHQHQQHQQQQPHRQHQHQQPPERLAQRPVIHTPDHTRNRRRASSPLVDDIPDTPMGSIASFFAASPSPARTRRTGTADGQRVDNPSFSLASPSRGVTQDALADFYSLAGTDLKTPTRVGAVSELTGWTANRTPLGLRTPTSSRRVRSSVHITPRSTLRRPMRPSSRTPGRSVSSVRPGQRTPRERLAQRSPPSSPSLPAAPKQLAFTVFSDEAPQATSGGEDESLAPILETALQLHAGNDNGTVDPYDVHQQLQRSQCFDLQSLPGVVESQTEDAPTELLQLLNGQPVHDLEVGARFLHVDSLIESHRAASAQPHRRVYAVSDLEDEEAISMTVCGPAMVSSSKCELGLTAQLASRISPEQRALVMLPMQLYVFRDHTCLINQWTPTGTTLADVMCMYERRGHGMDEDLVLFYAAELLRVLELLQTAQILHADIQPAKLAHRQDSSDRWDAWTAARTGSWSGKGLALFGFEFAVDCSNAAPHELPCFVPAAGACADWCAQMNQGHQADTFAVLSIIHRLLHGLDCPLQLDERRVPLRPLPGHVDQLLWASVFGQLLRPEKVHSARTVRDVIDQELGRRATRLKLQLCKQKCFLCESTDG